MLDLGCGSGEFLHRLGGALGGRASLTGLNISSEELQLGRRRFPEIDFVQGDLREAPRLLKGRAFDAVCMLGTHSIFDDVASWLDPVAALAAPNGIGFVLGLFNPQPYDVKTQWRRAGGADWHRGGYNYWSRDTVAARRTS